MSRAVVAGLKALTELSVFLHKLAGPIDHLIGGRYGEPLRPANSGNVVSVDEDGHVLCGVPTAGSMMVTWVRGLC